MCTKSQEVEFDFKEFEKKTGYEVLKIYTKEEYKIKFGRTYCYLRTYVLVHKEKKAHELLIDQKKYKLPKSTPKYLTKHNLWHCSPDQLHELNQIAFKLGEKRPSDKTIKQWKENVFTPNALKT